MRRNHDVFAAPARRGDEGLTPRRNGARRVGTYGRQARRVVWRRSHGPESIPEKKADAKKLGAHEFVLTNEEGALAKLANRYDAILDTISAKHDINGPLGCLKRDGTLMLIGAAPETLDLSAFWLIFGRRKVMGSLVGGIPETQEMLDHCGAHGITSDIELTTPEQINEAYERTLKGDVKYRFVIDCTKI